LTAESGFARSCDKTWPACPLAFTGSQIASILPSVPIRNVERAIPLKERPMNFFVRQAP